MLSASPFSFRDQLAFYGAYHTNKVNVAIHIVCVPMIWMTFLTLLLHAGVAFPRSELPEQVPEQVAPHLNIAALVAALYWIYYLVLDVPTAALIAPLWVAYYVVAWQLERVPHSAAIATGLFIFSWIAQFYGHGVHEGRAPALLDNLLGAVVLAPLFVFVEVLFHFGYAPELQRWLKNTTGRIVTDLRTQQAAEKRAKGQ